MKGLKHGIFILSAIFLLCTFVPLQAGATAPYITEGDFLYAENDDGTLSVFRYNGDANAVSIPAAVQGRPVTGISTNAFLFHATLREVTLPESIACIGMNAFGECSSLTSINL
ncbi:MAG TPA: leucine-rich repeat protein [Candidatus Scatavimonas merdigallinarum]|uniref:Leucine-rich repeat protein n=1 Tax=Candidatus Scatavimonas merdigallinarum TaxID=2840914 RepID=A0A9D0ZJ96_9FIRM|nr:leucine-rich repeat protein [Candidatus Scatavimonas merdigallinarum]